ncbi:hypothetical protein [Nocardia lasii]|uniref:Uncharacterized protein n=1 Tax=Nocardia lasii TaxID=1616107 RepID=A0ABW1JN30_9NOCA
MTFDEVLFWSRVLHGRGVLAQARRRLRTGRWVPSDLERRLAALLWQGVPPQANLEPHTLPDRARQVTAWSARLRLALLAGGWPEPGEEGVDKTVEELRLPEVLTAMLGIAMMIEPWEAELALHYRADPGRFRTDRPEVFGAIDYAEEVLCEYSHIMELLDEIAYVAS